MYKIESIHSKISIETIIKFEEENNVKLPTDYQFFLLEHNGGYVTPNVFNISDNEGESALNIFYGIGSMKGNLVKKIESFDEVWELGFMPIASDSGGNQICLGLKGKNAGKIYFYDHELEIESVKDLILLAKNLKDFLSSMYEDADE